MRARAGLLEIPSLSVVVCCYTEERWGALQSALDSLRAQQHPVDEIAIVVDHNDLLLERLRLQNRAEADDQIQVRGRGGRRRWRIDGERDRLIVEPEQSIARSGYMGRRKHPRPTDLQGDIRGVAAALRIGDRV